MKNSRVTHAPKRNKEIATAVLNGKNFASQAAKFWINPERFRKPSTGNITMAQKLDDSELVTFKELLLANSIQTDALAQLLIEKGIISSDEFLCHLYLSFQNIITRHIQPLLFLSS